MKIGEYPRMSALDDTDVLVFSKPSEGTKSIRAEDLIKQVADEVATEALLDTIVEQVQTRLLDKAYPVGAVYISLDSTDPSTLFGGTWERIAQGRCLFGADDSSYQSGQTKNAGLPDITGAFGSRYLDPNGSLPAVGDCGVTGAFYGGSATWTAQSTGGGSGWKTGLLSRVTAFAASRVNGIYGASTTVQPPALVVYMWKRTA